MRLHVLIICALSIVSAIRNVCSHLGPLLIQAVHHCKIYEVELIDVCALCSYILHMYVLYTSPEEVDLRILHRCGAMHLGFHDRISVILLRICIAFVPTMARIIAS